MREHFDRTAALRRADILQAGRCSVRGQKPQAGMLVAVRRDVGKPPRLPRDLYRGKICAFITCVTAGRRQVFAEPAISAQVLGMLRAETADDIEQTAFCLMPDHGHFLLTGLRDGSDVLRAVNRWKQATGYHLRRTHGHKLWQGNYRDSLLRDGSEAYRVAKYIASDPLRSGLVTDILEYPWWGSDRWSREQLAADIQNAVGPGFSPGTR